MTTIVDKEEWVKVAEFARRFKTSVSRIRIYLSRSEFAPYIRSYRCGSAHEYLWCTESVNRMKALLQYRNTWYDNRKKYNDTNAGQYMQD